MKNFPFDIPYIIASTSGGETSAYLLLQLLEFAEQNNYTGEIIPIFANTTAERQETLDFIKALDEYIHLHYSKKIILVEAETIPQRGKGVKPIIVDDVRYLRVDGSAFWDMVAKHGIPNSGAPHCTRELKERPITKVVKQIVGDSPYVTCIGIRADEFDRVNPKHAKLGLYYPLVEMGITKPMINTFWASMPFRLNLKGYEGNCATCWKKSKKKATPFSTR